MTAPPASDNTAFTTRVEVRAQSLFLAALVAGAVLTFTQLFSINRELGAIGANVATLTEQGRDHTAQLRDLDHRMTAIETQLKLLNDAIARLAPPRP
jgi:hypothetical protein